MGKTVFLPLEFHSLPEDEMRSRAEAFNERMRQRRSVRHFSDRGVPIEIIENCLKAAATAPSGANMQPWHFVLVKDLGLKRRIREAAEKEEREFYHGRAPKEWLEALEPLGTDEQKPFLEIAPYLIAVFAQTYRLTSDGRRLKNYYVSESVGIACGILITALHTCGLATLTHTPSPMGFLNEILNRPKNEKPYLLLVVGYPAEDARVPQIGKKPFSEVLTIY